MLKSLFNGKSQSKGYELISAIKANQIDEARAILDGTPKPRLDMIDKEDGNGAGILGHYSALGWAVINKQYDLVELLLQKGAHVDQKNREGTTALSIALEFWYYKKNEREERRPFIILLLDQGADLSQVDFRILFWALSVGDLGLAKRFIAHGAELEMPNYDNIWLYELVRSYIKNGFVDCLKLLMQLTGDQVGCTARLRCGLYEEASALWIAIEEAKPAVAELLLSHRGANINNTMVDVRYFGRERCESPSDTDKIVNYFVVKQLVAHASFDLAAIIFSYLPLYDSYLVADLDHLLKENNNPVVQLIRFLQDPIHNSNNVLSKLQASSFVTVRLFARALQLENKIDCEGLTLEQKFASYVYTDIKNSQELLICYPDPDATPIALTPEILNLLEMADADSLGEIRKLAETILPKPSKEKQKKLGEELMVAVEKGDVDDVMLSVMKGASLDFHREYDYRFPLRIAVKKENIEMVRLLIKLGANPNLCVMNSTALDMAIQKQCCGCQMALELLELGAAVNQVEGQSEPPLYDALLNYLPEVATVLIRKGADVDAHSKDGRTALMCVFDHLESKNFDMYYLPLALDLIAASKNLDVLYISKCESDWRNGKTFLEMALHDDKVALVEALVKAGALVNKRREDGYTPIFFALKDTDLSMTCLLLTYGADVNAKINCKYQKKLISPLERALFFESNEVAGHLLACGAKTVDDDGNSVFPSEKIRMEVEEISQSGRVYAVVRARRQYLAQHPSLVGATSLFNNGEPQGEAEGLSLSSRV